MFFKNVDLITLLRQKFRHDPSKIYDGDLICSNLINYCKPWIIFLMYHCIKLV